MQADPMLEASTEEMPEVAKPKWKRWLLRSGLIASAVLVGGALISVLVIAILVRDLPEIRSLGDYHPKQSTIVFGA